MSEILFETDAGIVFSKTVDKNNRCKVAVKHRSGHTHMTYRFKDVPGLNSQYVSWENLNCCNGWTYDKSYLRTAVQLGKKLYAGLAFFCGVGGEQDIDAALSELRGGLPDDCVFGKEEPPGQADGNSKFLNFFISRAGAIADYISLDEVFAAYDRLGIQIDAGAASRITEMCHVPLPQFAGSAAPFDYGGARGGVELITTGLLLGYPLESTAWLIERDSLFPVKQ